MSKIFVVEPWKMLQQAIALILIPAHEVRLSPAIPDAEDTVIREYDILIVDAAALKEQDRLSGENVRTVEKLGVPTIWIGEKDTERVPKHDKLFKVEPPLEKGAILSAVAECLKLLTDSEDKDTVAQPGTIRGLSRTRSEQKESESAGVGAQLIELVEVIEEEPTLKK
jgi:hypothetical protein